VVAIEDTGARVEVQFILFPCRRCGALAVAAADQKTKLCPSCSFSNKLAKAVVIKRFDDKETALDALRLAKIPRAERDGVPYVAGSAGSEEKRTTAEEVKIFFWTIKRTHPEGIVEADLLALATKEGLDARKVGKFVEKYKQEGTLLETGKQTLKFV
jgi:ribosomal protein L37E